MNFISASRFKRPLASYFDVDKREWVFPTSYLKYYLHQVNLSDCNHNKNHPDLGKWFVCDATSDIAVTKHRNRRSDAVKEFMRFLKKEGLLPEA